MGRIRKTLQLEGRNVHSMMLQPSKMSLGVTQWPAGGIVAPDRLEVPPINRAIDAGSVIGCEDLKLPYFGLSIG